MDADLSAVAGLMAEPHRARMLQILLGGTPQTGIALADETGISRSLASAHLKKLVQGGLVTSRPSGRMRLYQIASSRVAEAIETLMVIAPPAPAPRSLDAASRTRNLRWARMCYDHLAGAVGVAVAQGLIDRDLIREQDGGYVLAPRGPAGFGEFGIDIAELQRRSRPMLRPCLDWSERRHHLAGSLGAAIAAEMVRRSWLHTREASRIVTVTGAGEAGLRDWLGINLARARGRSAISRAGV